MKGMQSLNRGDPNFNVMYFRKDHLHPIFSLIWLCNCTAISIFNMMPVWPSAQIGSRCSIGYFCILLDRIDVLLDFNQWQLLIYTLRHSKQIINMYFKCPLFVIYSHVVWLMLYILYMLLIFTVFSFKLLDWIRNYHLNVLFYDASINRTPNFPVWVCLDIFWAYNFLLFLQQDLAEAAFMDGDIGCDMYSLGACM